MPSQKGTNPTFYRSIPFPTDTAIDLGQSSVPLTLIPSVKNIDAIHRIGDHVHVKEKEIADAADTQHTWTATKNTDHTVDRKHVPPTLQVVHLADLRLTLTLTGSRPDTGAERQPTRTRIRIRLIRLRQLNPVPSRGKSRRTERHLRPNPTHLIQLQHILK